MGIHIQAGTAWSKAKDAKKAGEAAAKAAMKKAGADSCNFVLVFASSKYAPQKVLDGVTKITKDAPLYGCTTAGEINEKGTHDGSVTVMVIKSKYVRVGVGVATGVRKNPVGAGKKAATNALKALKKEPRLQSLALFKKASWEMVKFHPYICLDAIDGLSGQEESVLDGIIQVMGTNPIIGGSAGDDLKLKKTYQFCNGKAYTDAVVTAVISTDLYTSIVSKHGWKSLSKTVVATKTDGRKLIEINHRPAVEGYAKLLNCDPKKLIKEGTIAFGTGLEYPLAIPDISGESWLRHPFSVEKDGSINFFSRIPKTAVLQLMKGKKEWLIHAGKQLAREAKEKAGGKPACGIMFNCVARKVLLGKGINSEIMEINALLDVPFAGFYTYGEQSPTSRGTNGHKNQTINLLLFADKLITD